MYEVRYVNGFWVTIFGKWGKLLDEHIFNIFRLFQWEHVFIGFDGKMETLEWLDNEALEKLKEDREPFEAPSSHYTPKPDEIGKMFWFSGK